MVKPVGNTSFSERVKAGKNLLYGISYTNDAGERLYYYVLIDNLKEKTFLSAMSGNRPFNIRDYGSVVSAGYGDPTPEVKAEMRDLYNANIPA